MDARLHDANDAELTNILQLLRSAFAYMDARIDPPSSMHRLTLDDLAQLCVAGEVWSMGNPIQACMVLHVKPHALYLGRLAVNTQNQGQGVGRQMVEHAVARAKDLQLPSLEIFTRIELVENQAFFRSLGFALSERRSHDGYAQPTYVVMRRPVSL